MESEAAAVPGYVNRPAGHVPQRRRQTGTSAGETGRRPRMRIALVAMRAYEQRAERRTRMRSWLLAQAPRGC